METYRAYGLVLNSALPLASLPRIRVEKAEDIDVNLDFGPPLSPPQALANPIGSHALAQPDWVQFHIPGVGGFTIAQGKEIRVTPDDGADAETLGLFVLGSCFGALLHQRGRLVLHGSAIRFGDRAAVFVGRSGAGKSTLAAALVRRGYPLLADDLSVVDGLGRVVPGYPQLKLWADAVERLGMDPKGLAHVRPQVEKYAYPLTADFCETPLPLDRIFVLQSHNKTEIRFEPITGMAKLAPIRNHTYRRNHIKGLGLQAAHLGLCSRLANGIPIIHVSRPSAGFALDELVDRVEAELVAAQESRMAKREAVLA